jgi:hypothetical protein
MLGVVERHAGDRPRPIDEQQRGDEAEQKAHDPIGHQGHASKRRQHHPRPESPAPWLARRPPTKGGGTAESSARTHVNLLAQGYAPPTAPHSPKLAHPKWPPHEPDGSHLTEVARHARVTLPAMSEPVVTRRATPRSPRRHARRQRSPRCSTGEPALEMEGALALLLFHQ